ncbi:MAG: hypothetical protein JJ859_18350 [Roseicyclus sp.]|nr:hypothetical protein [Roseicyclus sp.]
MRHTASQFHFYTVAVFHGHEHLAKPEEQLPSGVIVPITSVIDSERRVPFSILEALFCKTAMGVEELFLEFEFGCYPTDPFSQA